jgi:hypothetical protein
MELSYQRAQAAAVVLVEGGLKWESLRLVSCGDYARVVGRTFDRQEDRRNQRVEIVVTNQTMAPDPNGQPNDNILERRLTSAAGRRHHGHSRDLKPTIVSLDGTDEEIHRHAVRRRAKRLGDIGRGEHASDGPVIGPRHGPAIGRLGDEDEPPGVVQK